MRWLYFGVAANPGRSRNLWNRCKIGRSSLITLVQITTNTLHPPPLHFHFDTKSLQTSRPPNLCCSTRLQRQQIIIPAIRHQHYHTRGYVVPCAHSAQRSRGCIHLRVICLTRCRCAVDRCGRYGSRRIDSGADGPIDKRSAPSNSVADLVRCRPVAQPDNVSI